GIGNRPRRTPMERTSSQPLPAAPPGVLRVEATGGLRGGPSRRRAPVAVWLGVALLAASLAGVGLVLASSAGDSAAKATPVVPGGTLNREVAIGHVDVEEGVAALYPLQPGLVTRIEAREGEEVEASVPLLTLDDTVAQA